MSGETTIRVEVWDANDRRTEVIRVEPGDLSPTRQAQIVATLAGIMRTALVDESKQIPPINFVG